MIYLNKNDQGVNYSVWEYIARLFVLLFFIYCCFIFLENDSSPWGGFISSSIAFLCITVFATLILLKESRWIIFFVIAYIVRLLIGLFHFLYFILPDYFETKGVTLPLSNDFTSAFEAIAEIASAKKHLGLFHYEEVYWSHPEILNLMSYPFVYFGNYVLNITPLNSFMSVLTSINIYLIGKYIYNFDRKKLRFITIISAYFPLTLISSLFYRDVTGLAIMSIGMTLIMLSRNGLIQYLMLGIGCYLFSLHRTIYPVVLLLAFFINYFLLLKKRVSARNRIFQFVVILPVVIILIFISIVAGFSENKVYVDGGASINFLGLPVKLIMGMIGPFPWTQYFTTGRLEYSYQFSDYLQGTLNVSIFFLLYYFRDSYFKKEQFNLFNITGLLLIIVGLSTTFMHISYVSTGVIFLLPWIANSINRYKIKQYYFISFLALLFFSLIIVLFIGSLGFKDLWA